MTEVYKSKKGMHLIGAYMSNLEEDEESKKAKAKKSVKKQNFK